MKDAFLDCEAALTDWQENIDSFDEASFKIDRTNNKLEDILITNIKSKFYFCYIILFVLLLDI